MADQSEKSSAVLQQILNSLSTSPDQPQNSVSELIDHLSTVLTQSDPDDEDSEATAFQTLIQVLQFLSSPWQDQEVFDQLLFELPKAVSEFGGVSERCLEVVESIIDRFVAMCGARDMLSVLGEALAFVTEKGGNFGHVVPLFSGFSKVFLCLERHHYQQVKEATGIILKVLKAVSLELEVEADLQKIFDRAVGIANSIHAVCLKLEGGAYEKLCALLGLYALEITALVSMKFEVSSCQPFVLQLSSFLPFCGLSYLSLITGSDVDKLSTLVIEDIYVSCLSDIKCGASLSVIWGLASEEVARAAEEDLSAVKSELQNNQTKRWRAFGMLKHILASVTLPWELKRHAINFLLSIKAGNVSPCGEHIDLSSDMPGLFAVLQAVQMVIMYTPDTKLRKIAFEAFKWILSDIPASHRFDVLKALITSSDSSSMIAILLDIVKEEMHKESCKELENGEVLQEENKAHPCSSLWSSDILELVEMILRPPKGGPPSFPEQTDSVLSALNLYRYVLIAESRGKTNYTRVLSRSNLQKAYNEWLLPLRTLLTGIVATNKNDNEELALDTLCTFNPVELVLYRCIELVEENLKEST